MLESVFSHWRLSRLCFIRPWLLFLSTKQQLNCMQLKLRSKSPICEHSMQSLLYWHYCPGLHIWPDPSLPPPLGGATAPRRHFLSASASYIHYLRLLQVALDVKLKALKEFLKILVSWTAASMNSVRYMGRLRSGYWSIYMSHSIFVMIGRGTWAS